MMTSLSRPAVTSHGQQDSRATNTHHQKFSPDPPPIRPAVIARRVGQKCIAHAGPRCLRDPRAPRYHSKSKQRHKDRQGKNHFGATHGGAQTAE